MWGNEVESAQQGPGKDTCFSPSYTRDQLEATLKKMADDEAKKK